MVVIAGIAVATVRCTLATGYTLIAYTLQRSTAVVAAMTCLSHRAVTAGAAGETDEHQQSRERAALHRRSNRRRSVRRLAVYSAVVAGRPTMAVSFACVCAGLVVSAGFAGGSAIAEPALENGKPASPAAVTATDRTPSTAGDAAGKRDRLHTIQWRAPVARRPRRRIRRRGCGSAACGSQRASVDLLLTRAAGGAQNFGIGVELTRDGPRTRRVRAVRSGRVH
jgi:hypothetical protein